MTKEQYYHMELLRNANARIAWETAQANMELARYGEWQSDHYRAVNEAQCDAEKSIAVLGDTGGAY